MLRNCILILWVWKSGEPIFIEKNLQLSSVSHARRNEQHMADLGEQSAAVLVISKSEESSVNRIRGSGSFAVVF